MCFCFAVQTAQAGPGAYRITGDRAAAAVAAAHPELSGDAIELPVPIAADTAAPLLSAGPVERWGASATARVCLQCQGAGVCLPFYAIVHLQSAPASKPEGSAPVPRSEPPAAMHVGQRASLLIDSGMLHLEVAVTCLQAGAVGSTIRVAGPGRRIIYKAAVLDGATLRGTL